MRLLELFLFNHAQFCSGPESRLNLKVALSVQVCAAASAGMRAMMAALENIFEP